MVPITRWQVTPHEAYAKPEKANKRPARNKFFLRIRFSPGGEELHQNVKMTVRPASELFQCVGDGFIDPALKLSDLDVAAELARQTMEQAPLLQIKGRINRGAQQGAAGIISLLFFIVNRVGGFNLD